MRAQICGQQHNLYHYLRMERVRNHIAGVIALNPGTASTIPLVPGAGRHRFP
jgi:hypothetical protein